MCPSASAEYPYLTEANNFSSGLFKTLLLSVVTQRKSQSMESLPVPDQSEPFSAPQKQLANIKVQSQCPISAAE
jgi:hypothetical protein